MLVQFTVENFRSIKEEQTLSLVKNSSSEMEDNYFNSTAPLTPELLKTAVIYGANASGKSNILKALFSMSKIISESFNKKLDTSIRVEPYILDPITRVQPSTFIITLVVNLPNDSGLYNPVRVEYGFSADKKLVHEEWLSVFPKSREQAWFHRLWNFETKQYDWIKDSDLFKGQKKTWKDNTRSDQLFLSTAVHLNSDQLIPIYNALTEDINVIGDDRISNKLTKDSCKKNIHHKNFIISLMQQADIDVDDILFKKDKIKFRLPENMPDELKSRLSEDLASHLEVFFVHTDSLGNQIEINLNDESDGTQKVFEFASLILLTLEQGKVLIVDEFNKSLHPDLVRYLVKLFNSRNNRGNGQLIFTTHETSILRKDLLRRDQIWFCEKNRLKETSLYPLTNFSPRKDGREDIEECYLHGRYGGKPVIQPFEYPPELLDKNLISLEDDIDD